MNLSESVLNNREQGGASAPNGFPQLPVSGKYVNAELLGKENQEASKGLIISQHVWKIYVLVITPSSP
jgi:hypothetical protein